ncbi:hypothetical protein N7457_001559 [Penicillium paradoxum]|uniref:uncharacterized protein n=1 Tax=Penicillium paradoxum TaxID=176176 RepID=UPI0025488203|nr:uncharacterized protein N7457_001559 [Penicillium paradoxum]KAJ5794960.1 hypothetical protein N7457_001559 [Penicillium paradoxum]
MKAAVVKDFNEGYEVCEVDVPQPANPTSPLWTESDQSTHTASAAPAIHARTRGSSSARSGLILESTPYDEVAPPFCPGATVYGALLASGVKRGEWIALGGLGYLGVQYDQTRGAKVVAI